MLSSSLTLLVSVSPYPMQMFPNERRSKAAARGETSSGSHFDSNCITPGTLFMRRLTERLRFFVAKKMAEDPHWAKLEVILSGPDVHYADSLAQLITSLRQSLVYPRI